MSAPGHRKRVGVLTGAAGCALATVTLIGTAAAAVSLSGAADDARGLLQFGFEGVPDSSAEVARIARHNAKFVLGATACAAVVPHTTPRVRRAIDALLSGLLVLNAATIGIAIGAYGTRVITALTPHLPLEIAATSVAGGVYLSNRRAALPPATIAAAAAGSMALLIVAAVLETYVSTGASR